MKRHPAVRQLQSFPKYPISRGDATEGARDRLSKLFADPDFIAVAAFSAIGFLIALNAIIYFPAFSAIIQQSAAFP